MTQSLSQYSQAKPAKGTDLTLKGYGPVAAETVGQPMTLDPSLPSSSPFPSYSGPDLRVAFNWNLCNHDVGLKSNDEAANGRNSPTANLPNVK